MQARVTWDPAMPADRAMPAVGRSPAPGLIALDVNAQTVFGLGAGLPKADDVIDTVSAQLGPVTSDTDWYTLPKTGAGGAADCLADQESRHPAFGPTCRSCCGARPETSRSGAGRSATPRSPATAIVASPTSPRPLLPTGLRTAEGIAVGSTFDDLANAYGERFQFFPLTPDDTTGVHVATPDAKTPAGASLTLMELGGPIVGIGSTINFC